MIELRGVTKRYGTTLAVKNLLFEVRDGEFIVIFGPAGAGKSTTLRLIAGVTEPTYGDILYDGHSLKGVPPEGRNFSMVFENYALYSHLTVFENLAFPLRARKTPEAEIRRRVLEMGDLLHIGEMLDRKPGFLSGGQRQRVALGRGLIRDAAIYLLDEPISHLDARLRIQMRAELKNICLEKASTVIHVTHDYREAMALADRVIVLNKGRLMQDDRPETVYNQPANDFVARFVGDPPMSFLKAGLSSHEGQPGFTHPALERPIPAAADFTARTGGVDVSSSVLQLGLRANQTSLAAAEDPAHRAPVTIYLVEAQGHRNLVTAKLGEDFIQVVTAPDEDWKVGEKAWLCLDPAILHVFADGQAIYHPDPQPEIAASPSR
jgi:multiple sugar transport system ATP-binding protein